MNKEWEQVVWNCALRYALGRRTYITGCVADFITEVIPELTEKTKSVMIRDIEECDDLGDDCDKESWIKLLKKLKNEQTKQSHNPSLTSRM